MRTCPASRYRQPADPNFPYPPQGLLISILPISNPQNAKALQNFIICLEMLGSSIAMYFAFPVSDFKIGGVATGMRMGAMIHAISIRDVLADVLHQFAGMCRHSACSTLVSWLDGRWKRRQINLAAAGRYIQSQLCKAHASGSGSYS